MGNVPLFRYQLFQSGGRVFFSLLHFHISFAFNPIRAASDSIALTRFTRVATPVHIAAAATTENLIFIGAMAMGEENVPSFARK